MYSEGGQGFVVLQSTATDGVSRRSCPASPPGDVVTTLKNTVDKVVTEWGVAELRGRSIRQRTAKALIAIAHPDHREMLAAEACRSATLRACCAARPGVAGSATSPRPRR